MADNRTQSRRRWFSFSLRTMFVALTLLSVPLGYVTWQAKIVRDRKEMERWVFCAGGGFTIRTYDAKAPPELRSPPKPSWIRRLFGDRLYVSVTVPTTTSDEDFRRVIEVFPEAEAEKMDGPSLNPYDCETAKTVED